MAENLSGESDAEDGFRRVRTTGMFAAGLPIVVSSTWQVIGGFFSVDILWLLGVAGGATMWLESASMRCVAREESMQVEELEACV